MIGVHIITYLIISTAAAVAAATASSAAAASAATIINISLLLISLFHSIGIRALFVSQDDAWSAACRYIYSSVNMCC